MKAIKIIFLAVSILSMIAGCKNRDMGPLKEENNAIREPKTPEITTDSLEYYYSFALNYAETKNEKVLVLCDSLIRTDPLDAQAAPYYYKGIYYSNVNEKNKALQQFDAAIQRNYNFLDAYIEKAAVLYEMKKYTEGISVLNLALTISPGLTDAWYWLGKVNEAMGDKSAALLNYSKAYELDKSMTEAKQGMERMD